MIIVLAYPQNPGERSKAPTIAPNGSFTTPNRSGALEAALVSLDPKPYVSLIYPIYSLIMPLYTAPRVSELG